jgi:hypothetical protein
MVAPKKPRIATSAEISGVVHGRRLSRVLDDLELEAGRVRDANQKRAPRRSWMPV